MKTNLSKALKIKNRVAGELVKLQAIFKRENSRRDDNPSKVDVEQVFGECNKKRALLIGIKSAITAANVPIYPALAELSEVKSEIAFLATLPVKEGNETAAIGYSKETKDYTWTAFLNQQRVDERVALLQRRADELQDEIDTANATITVELPE